MPVASAGPIRTNAARKRRAGMATTEVSPTRAGSDPVTAVLHVGGLHYGSQQAVVERVPGRPPGRARANSVAQTATGCCPTSSTGYCPTS